MKKIAKIFWSILMSILLMGVNPISVMAEGQSVVDYDHFNDFTYNLVKDDESERIINYVEGNADVTIIYNKKNISFTIIKNIDGQLSTEVFKSGNLLQRDNSSMFSPWEYSSSGTRYTLTAVIDGNTVSKTVNRNTSNGPSIDSFCNAVDDIRDVEGDLLLELGADLVGPLIIAALTGGVGLVALLTAIGASASALSNGQKLNTLYARAEKAYKEV